MRRDDERLADMLEACDKIAARAALGRDSFDANEDVQLAVVHLVQVVGEMQAIRGASGPAAC